MGGRRGVENGPAGGGDLDFSCRGGNTFCSRRGEGYCKIEKRALKMHFFKEFWKNVQNMCNFPFLGTFFMISIDSMGKNFS